ncbi:2-dehydro-3-deoxy-D-gluconate 5-dehydrogenase KduD [Devosia sp. MC532]|uniref:2-dehydro-3-deoxy-D-gluconate 5-dehydrogenase KduD n=1 Tax=Devosia sp. MC532 TaxID=2799788 RepID=UPI0018F674D8|nr:2-dehydro-3-deoxy-D-gluconate 5-dehydrogenase KduD [Devosia sp. MC532]MBJ7578770.1 2-dehydro-3-deoxy-D-gluconate 5-dehydrogenase KduD [Devosia sp. MC532]
MDLSAFSLSGKTVMVTGANTGIGQGIALSIGRAGGRVIGVGRSTMDETASIMEAQGSGFIAVQSDLSSPSAAQGMFDAAWADYGPIHGLVNNAGIIKRVDAVHFSEEDWDSVMDVNLKTVFFLCQSLGRKALAEGRQARIVNIASMLSYQGGIRVASYTASKSGVMGITKLLANEWAAKGINVNAIAPGYIETNNTEALRNDPDRSASILGRIPAGRWGVSSDIGDAAVFLLAPASNYVHGATIPVDGGWLAR